MFPLLDSSLPARLPATLPELIRERLLRGSLPGRAAHRFASPRLAFGRHSGPPPATARVAAVTVLLYERDSDWRMPLTLRPTHLPSHGGQVSLPGGGASEGETAEQTAARELREELGIVEPKVEFLGRLTPVYVFNSNYAVTPCVAFAGSMTTLAPDPAEVAYVIEARLSALADPQHYGSHWIERRGLRFEAPHVLCQGHRIWGATWLILAELLCVIAQAVGAKEVA